MTPEQKLESTQKKVQAVNTLCNQLMLIPVAKQAITEEGIIEMKVFFQDLEQYPDEPKEEPKKPVTKKKNVKSKTTNL